MQFKDVLSIAQQIERHAEDYPLLQLTYDLVDDYWIACFSVELDFLYIPIHDASTDIDFYLSYFDGQYPPDS